MSLEFLVVHLDVRPNRSLENKNRLRLLDYPFNLSLFCYLKL